MPAKKAARSRKASTRVVTSETPTTADKAVTEEPQFPNAGRDQEIYDRQQQELAAEREEHNRRTGGGAYPLSSQK